MHSFETKIDAQACNVSYTYGQESSGWISLLKFVIKTSSFNKFQKPYFLFNVIGQSILVDICGCFTRNILKHTNLTQCWDTLKKSKNAKRLEKICFHKNNYLQPIQEINFFSFFKST